MAGNEAFVAALKAKPHEKIILTKKMLLQPELFGGPFFIINFTDDPVNSRIYNGYRIQLLDQDLRYCLGKEEVFKAWWLGGNEVMVQLPSASYTFYHDVAAEQRGKTKAGDLNPRISQATNIARNGIKNNEERLFKRILLQLPTLVDDHNNLDNSVYSPNAENGKIKSKVVVLESEFEVPTKNSSGDITMKKVSSLRCDVHWNIAIWEPTYRAETVASKGSNDQMEQLANQLAVLQTDTVMEDASVEEPARRRREDSATNVQADQIVLFGSDEQQQESPSKKRHKQTEKQPAASGSFAALSSKTFWQRAFSSDTSDAIPTTEQIDEIEPGQETTEMVEFMETERSKDARKGDGKDGGRNKRSKKKSQAVLGDDEAVWGANGPMGPHFQDDYFEEDKDL